MDTIALEMGKTYVKYLRDSARRGPKGLSSLDSPDEESRSVILSLDEEFRPFMSPLDEEESRSVIPSLGEDELPPLMPLTVQRQVTPGISMEPKRRIWNEDHPEVTDRSSRVFVPGNLNGIPMDALPDSGADNCCIDLAIARKNNLEVLPTNKKHIVLGSGKAICPVGEVRADWTFRGEHEVHTLVLYVLKTLTADLALGNPFLKATKTFTEHKSRISRTAGALSRKLFRLMLLGGGTDRIRGYLDGEEVHALPDTGAEIMAMSTAMALRQGYVIDDREESRIMIEFADGSTKLARGLVRGLEWDFGPGSKPASNNIDSPGVPRVRCDFYVVDDLLVDVILSADFVLDFDVFSPKYEACFLDGRGPADASLGMFCNIRVVKKWLKSVPRLWGQRSSAIPVTQPASVNSTSVGDFLPDAFPPQVVMRECKRRKDIIAANWLGMDQADIDREKNYWRAWDAAKEHYYSRRHPPQQSDRAGGAPGRGGVQVSSDGRTSSLSSPGQGSTPSLGASAAIPLANIQPLPRPTTGDLTEWTRMVDRVFSPSVHSAG
ncbi:hypothetical protein RB594_007687 [Gaeumannomyces avenae]